MAGLNCPQCGFDKTCVVDSRKVADGIRRRRECEQCGYRWTTYECGSDLMHRLMNRAYKTGLKKARERIEKIENHNVGLPI